MDTKSRNYSHSKIAKVIAFILVVVSFTTMAVISAKTLDEDRDIINMIDNPDEENYYLSANYGLQVENIMTDLIDISTKYKDEEYIKSGKSIDKEELKGLEEELFSEFRYNRHGYNDDEDNYEKLKKDFELEYKEEIYEIQNKLIIKELREFNSIVTRLNQNKGLIYHVKKGETVFSNTKDNSVSSFKKYPAYIISEDGEYSLSPKQFEQSKYYNIQHDNTEEKLSQVDQIKIAFTEDYIDERQSEWNKMKQETKESRKIIKQLIYKLLVILSILLLALIYLILVTGRKSFRDNKLKVSSIDKLYSDINVLFMIIIIPIWLVVSSNIFIGIRGELSVIFIAVGSALACSLVLILLLSFVRHIKNKTIFSNSLISALFKDINKAGNVAKDIYNGENIVKKVTLAVIGFSLLILITFFMFPVTIGIAIWLAYKKTNDYIKIKEGVERIKNGEVDHKIDIENDGEFKNLAIDINSIGEGFYSAIENELKSERLKTELITNVSHDIRTPLTSIITYVDLIKNEKDKTKINEYIEIIEQKAHRLKTLTDDLFEASKATSGNIPVNYEKIDIVSLITQGLGELDTQVQESGLDFKINNFAEKIYVNADGKLLWRSLENLLTNIFKYSVTGSRVYIDIVDLGERIELSIKNISAYELNISSDELLERFKRGDESRGSEGSGLGLSISKSLIEVQNGDFEIFIDGDLFKVIIILESLSKD